MSNNKDGLSVMLSIVTVMLSIVTLIVAVLNFITIGVVDGSIKNIDLSVKEIDLFDKQQNIKTFDLRFEPKKVGDNTFHIRYVIVNKSKRFLSIENRLNDKMDENNKSTPKHPCMLKEKTKDLRNPVLVLNDGNPKEKYTKALFPLGKMYVPPESERSIDYLIDIRNDELNALEFCIEVCSDVASSTSDSCGTDQYSQVYQVDFIGK